MLFVCVTAVEGDPHADDFQTKTKELEGFVVVRPDAECERECVAVVHLILIAARLRYEHVRGPVQTAHLASHELTIDIPSANVSR